MRTDPAEADLAVDLDSDRHVAVVEIRRGPNNYFDTRLIGGVADAFEELARDPACRAIVLCSQGRHFCVGRDFREVRAEDDDAGALYEHAVRIVAAPLPWVAAVQGAAIGGGFGLALAADLRVAGPHARFHANFTTIGIHHGFGMSVTLPAVVGEQRASELLLTARVVGAREAERIGLADRVAPEHGERREAMDLAAQIAANAPLAVRSVRAARRSGLVERFREATALEAAEQERLRATRDHAEGVGAARERRTPRFEGR